MIRLILVTLLLSSLPVFGMPPLSKVRFHNMETDTARITKMLIDAEKINEPSERIVYIADQFVDLPYVASTLENPGGEELLTVNLDELDCTTFVETVIALAMTAGEHRTSWRDFLVTLEKLRYRSGEMIGYPSRLHYFSDWVVDNVHRGNVTEITGDLPDHRDQTKSIDFMTRNAEKYPALADSSNLTELKNYERGYRNHRYYYLPWNKINDKHNRDKLRNGDIVAFITKTPGLDVTHQGLIIKDEKGVPYMLHASMSEGKVLLNKEPLLEQLRKGRIPGVRIVRMNE